MNSNERGKMKKVKLTRTNNYEGSYSYTSEKTGIEYEIINWYRAGYTERANEWAILNCNTGETEMYFDTLAEVRKALAGEMEIEF